MEDGDTLDQDIVVERGYGYQVGFKTGFMVGLGIGLTILGIFAPTLRHCIFG